MALCETQLPLLFVYQTMYWSALPFFQATS